MDAMGDKDARGAMDAKDGLPGMNTEGTAGAAAAQGGSEGAGTAGGAEPLVRFRGIRKAFGDNVVLRDLDLDVAPGEKVALIGPSGSGKTTILRMLMTLERPDAGTVEIGGEQLWQMPRGARMVPADERHLRRMRGRIGMVFQQFNLFPHMKVLRNVTEAQVRVLGVPKETAEKEARELLEMVGIGDKADQYPAQLSGGQQQRVAIARAVALRPDVMLFDEVTSALDPELVAEVLRVLRELAQRTDMTMLIVTHEMNFARDVSDRVLMFDSGKVIEQGAPDRIFSDPQEERTRGFLRAVLEAS
jgi:polar amino acid transport system ATP-binding protein